MKFFPDTQAFPGETDRGFHKGMDLQSFFAVNAPTEIPDWFKHTFTKKPNKRPYLHQTFGKNSEHEHKNFFLEFYNTEDDVWFVDDNKIPVGLKQAVEDHVAGLESDIKEIEKWEYENQVARYFQWRVFYANNLINELNANK